MVSVAEPNGHADLGGYVLGRLTDAERRRFEDHLESCEECRAELPELESAAALMESAAPAVAVPVGLEGRVFVAVEQAALAAEADTVDTSPAAVAAQPRPRRLRRPVLAWGAGALAVAAAAVLVAVFASGGPAGELELRTTLGSPSGAQAAVEVRKTGIGRVIELRTDELPILPQGEYYELWFVGPGDTPESPNRISAGTFHPDEDGRSDVRFAAAVDPALYPVLSVTAEPGDGDPRPTGPEVLRSRT